jgi:shikimate kinase
VTPVRRDVSAVPLLFLIGARGTGKTTVARLLAARLQWPWIDADDVIEQQFGRSVRDIFAQEGEAGFRIKEASVLAALCDRRQHVIATGGGVVLRADNRERLRQAGKVVWLTADPVTLWQRLQNDPHTAERRPNLSVGGLVEIEETLRVREPFYRACADSIVSTAGRSPEEVTAVVLAHLTSDPNVLSGFAIIQIWYGLAPGNRVSDPLVCGPALVRLGAAGVHCGRSRGQFPQRVHLPPTAGKKHHLAGLALWLLPSTNPLVR